MKHRFYSFPQQSRAWLSLLLAGPLALSSAEAQTTAKVLVPAYSQPASLVVSGNTTFPQGGSVTLTAKPNLALAFDGSSNYVTTTLDAQPSALPTTTWEAWVYPTRTNYSLRQTLFSVDDGAYDRGVEIEANTANFCIFTGTGTWMPVAVDLNAWQHIAVVYTPTGIYFYKNGVEYIYNTANGFSLNSTNNKFQIGRNPGFNEPFKGQMDEVRVWNYQRSQAQIQAGMSAPPAGTTSGLVASWRFNEGSGATAASETGTSPGTLVGGTAYVTPGQTAIGTATFAWMPTTGLSASNTASVVASPTATTTYSVAVTDAAAATSSASQLVTVTPAPDLTVSNTAAVPAGSYTNLVVANGGVATLSGATTIYGFVTVQAGGTLNTNCQALTGPGTFSLLVGGTLGICDPAGIAATGAVGAVQVTGTRSFAADASYLYNGTAAQSTGSGLPSQVRNLTTTNASDVTLSAPVSIVQALTVGGAGNLQLNGKALTLLSSAGGTALVVNSGAGTVLGSTATVQRYLDPTLNSGLGYRHYSAPVAGSTVNDLLTTGFTPVVNSAYNTSATPGLITPFPTVFGYDQSRLSSVGSNYSAFDKGFYSPSSLTDGLAVGQGYAVQLDAAQLVDFTGQLNTGTKPLILTRNSDATAPDAGWALVGNPYPSPLDWNQVAPADRLNLDGSIYVVQSSGPYTGAYRTYVNNVSTSPTNNPLIGTGQGFFVRVSSGQSSGTLTFRNSQRVTGYASQASVNRTTDSRPLVRLELRTSAGQADGLAVYAEAGATPSFDAQYDAGKLANSTGLNLASLSTANEPLAIDGRPAFTAATVVPLTVGVPAAGTYSLAAAALSNLPTGLDAYLTDAKTGQTTQLSAQASYSFSVTATEATALLTGRFTLRFSPQTALAATPILAATDISLYPSPAHESFAVRLPAVVGASQVQARLLNALGQLVRQQEAALPAAGTTLTVETAGLAAGVYTLRLQAGATTLSKRVIIN